MKMCSSIFKINNPQDIKLKLGLCLCDAPPRAEGFQDNTEKKRLRDSGYPNNPVALRVPK
jgi:hypothetical protein